MFLAFLISRQDIALRLFSESEVQLIMPALPFAQQTHANSKRGLAGLDAEC